MGNPMTMSRLLSQP